MVRSVDAEYKPILDRVSEHGQEHVLRFWDELTAGERDLLLEQIKEIDFELLEQHKKMLQKGASYSRGSSGRPAPPPYLPIPESDAEKAAAQRAKETGEDAIRSGNVAAFLVAGGQGTRLGYDGPKGCYPIGPVSGATLFQIHAEKILAARRRYSATIPWAIMTSSTNDQATKEFFTRNDYFGLPREDIYFFSQRMIPTLDAHGRLILDRKNHIFMNPDGHGGSLLALWRSGVLQKLQDRGTEILSYFQVDNALVRVIDPVFIGHHLMAGSEMSSKMVAKKDPDEKVGLFVQLNGGIRVIEYSELSGEQARIRDSQGRLRFRAGSIAIHLIDCAFVKRLTCGGFKLPFHLAFKKIPCLDSHGERIDPEQPNGYKFETFVFDALADTDASVVMEIDRDEEFCPLKNAEGENSPETVRAKIIAYYARWLEAAGTPVPRDTRGAPSIPVEISPLFALDREEFVRRAGNMKINCGEGLYLAPH